jgi:hypothetical protein
MRQIGAPLLRLFGTNWITLFGASVTTVSAVAMVLFLLLGLIGLANSPYVALMALLVLPAFFVAGLLLIPLGIWIHRRQETAIAAGERKAATGYPVVDFKRPKTRRIAVGLALLTTVNVLIVGVVSYEGVHYMDSTEFCGQVCHTVMQPEFAAYQGSPHSRVACVECHIGPGAPWFVRAKLSGMGQVIAVTLNNYERPIPSPVAALRPSQDICENCHWPAKFSGDRVRVINRFETDEANTPIKSVLVMHIGGGDRSTGIHSWHVNKGHETYYYASDERRQVIPWVQVREGDKQTEFLAEGFDVSTMDRSKIRRMDCIDCHNRPTHVFMLPGDAVDAAISDGRIDRSIPSIREAAEEVLLEVGDSLAPSAEVKAKLIGFYQSNHADYYSSNQEKVEQAAVAAEQIYARNIFPDMKLGWGYHPMNLDHDGMNFEGGCMRCHDGSHTSSDGRSIEQDCESCHTVLATEEQNPDILSQLGLEQ